LSALVPGVLNPGAATHILCVVQAGSFAEHVVHTAQVDDGPVQDVRGPYCRVELSGGTQVRLTLTMTLRGGRPTCDAPVWEVSR
jgi:hypothetical protein